VAFLSPVKSCCSDDVDDVEDADASTDVDDVEDADASTDVKFDISNTEEEF
jgi:hypothetical protein